MAKRSETRKLRRREEREFKRLEKEFKAKVFKRLESLVELSEEGVVNVVNMEDKAVKEMILKQKGEKDGTSEET